MLPNLVDFVDFGCLCRRDVAELSRDLLAKKQEFDQMKVGERTSKQRFLEWLLSCMENCRSRGGSRSKARVRAVSFSNFTLFRTSTRVWRNLKARESLAWKHWYHSVRQEKGT